MTVPTRLVWLAVALAGLGGLAVRAQTLRESGDQPMVFSGSDLGFRVERMDGRIPVGRLVVRINGQWVEVQFERTVVPLVR